MTEPAEISNPLSYNLPHTELSQLEMDQSQWFSSRYQKEDILFVNLKTVLPSSDLHLYFIFSIFDFFTRLAFFSTGSSAPQPIGWLGIEGKPLVSSLQTLVMTSGLATLEATCKYISVGWFFPSFLSAFIWVSCPQWFLWTLSTRQSWLWRLAPQL